MLLENELPPVSFQRRIRNPSQVIIMLNVEKEYTELEKYLKKVCEYVHLNGTRCGGMFKKDKDDKTHRIKWPYPCLLCNSIEKCQYQMVTKVYSIPSHCVNPDIVSPAVITVKLLNIDR